MASLCRASPKFILLNLSRRVQPTACQTQSSTTRLKGLAVTNATIYNRKFSDKKQNDDDAEDSTPVVFSTSQAAEWKAEYSRMGAKDDGSPSSQPYFVSCSIAVFLLYFLVLREENDIDIKLGGGNFNDTATYIEYIQLKTVVNDDIVNNVKTDPKVLERLAILEQSRSPVKLAS